MHKNPPHLIHLSSGDVSVVLDCSDAQLPAVVHWGAALGEQTADELAALALANVEPITGSSPDRPIRVSILPEQHTGWTGIPGIAGHRDGHGWSPKFTATRIRVHEAGAAVPAGPGGMIAAGAATLEVIAEDETAGLTVALEVEMLQSGLLRSRAILTNTGSGTYTLDGINLAFPIPGRAREILDFAGRWGKERTPQRRELVVGVHDRFGRRGRTGPDAATILEVGTPGFGFADGEIWGTHVAFSGNHRHFAERLANGMQTIGGGELLLPGEIRLIEGDSYASPWLYGAYAVGLDEQADRFHRYLRSRPQHPRSPRPVTLNVWEAVYFDHDVARLVDLADRASALGVERFVLDDGWFRHRRNDRAGLGDWYVDETVWPDGLAPLVDHVRDLDMQFGLWFEPEMINEDSDLAREHPEWIMRADGRLPVTGRHQQVLDLGNPAAYAHIRDRIASIIDEYGVDYIKWDHNRDLVDAGGLDGTPGVHAQTIATYRLMSELKNRFPHLEIESCSSGGARVDLGIIEHTDRVWVSDCIDPLERQQMNRWTMQLLPPELLGSHIASGTSHTTGRAHTLSFRAGTALFGHVGIEWDIAAASVDELHQLHEWIVLYKRTRDAQHNGRLVRVDQADPTQLVYGTIADNASHAMMFLATVGRSEVSPRGRVTFRQLDPATRYRIVRIAIGDEGGIDEPEWARAGVPLIMSGRALQHVGFQAPAMLPDRVAVFELTAV